MSRTKNMINIALHPDILSEYLETEKELMAFCLAKILIDNGYIVNVEVDKNVLQRFEVYQSE